VRAVNASGPRRCQFGHSPGQHDRYSSCCAPTDESLSTSTQAPLGRAKTDRLDTELLKRGFLGWLRGERGHCSMARAPTIAEEDAKRPALVRYEHT
jgi:hypothetical protein